MESQVGPPKHHIPERTTSHLSQFALTELDLQDPGCLPCRRGRSGTDWVFVLLCAGTGPAHPLIMIPLLKFLLSSTFQPRLTAWRELSARPDEACGRFLL